MAHKTVTIRPVDKKYAKGSIDVDHPVVKVKKHVKKVSFKNDLTSDAEIEFFDLDDKSGSPIEGFCKSGMTGTKLVIAKGTKADCKFDDDLGGGDFAYTIAATGYQTLDPVIIIEPPFSQSLSFSHAPVTPAQPFDPFAAGATLLIGVALGILFGRIIK